MPKKLSDMSDYEYSMMQAKKALEFVRSAPKGKDGKLKNRKLAKHASALLRAMRSKDAKAILDRSGDVMGEA